MVGVVLKAYPIYSETKFCVKMLSAEMQKYLIDEDRYYGTIMKERPPYHKYQYNSTVLKIVINIS